jgi:hypothetical protein
MRVFGVYGLVCAGMYSFGGFWFSSDKASRTPSDYNPYALPHRRNATATTETTYNKMQQAEEEEDQLILASRQP